MSPSLIVWSLVLLANVITFLLWGADKRRSRLARRRIAEKTLLWWAFATGVVGAWVGVSVFRHKTRKWSFRWRLILVSVVNPLWLVIWWQVEELRG